ncbi:MAG: methyltransferase [Lachnospiraceae bacterium]|nr:methyltransferase [Lachnospiraceae bacterium]
MNSAECYLQPDGTPKPEMLGSNPWLALLTETEHVYVNAERIESVGTISGRETLDYVMRSLDILQEIADTGRLDDDARGEMRRIITTVLQWAETAKGGSHAQRSEWTEKGYPLDIHNEGSAMIYKEYAERGEVVYDERIFQLIRTHGLIGQSIRGEIPVSHNASLYAMAGRSNLDWYRLLYTLNECIIRAAGERIWNSVRYDVATLIRRILEGDWSEFSTQYRLERLCPAEYDIYDEDAWFFEQEIFPRYELWYFTSALGAFEIGQIRVILRAVLDEIARRESAAGADGAAVKDAAVRHLNFKPLADSLWYDYEGKKRINIYKKRIIEKYLRDASVQNVNLCVTIENGTAYVDFAFSKVCEKLIDFCVEAERCGLLTFEKSIIVLYDMFGFRRDAFDRLNNENKYLATMNQTANSTKESIISYVTGRTVVDVGSGGGVLLDRLEQNFPEKRIIGTDISANVIDVLNGKKAKEGHRWEVRIHNFVEGEFGEPVDSVIFSSILHEIYSYTETERGRFDIESVKKALCNAYRSLCPGGRIIIRDGVKTDSKELRTVHFADASGLEFLQNYRQDFRGLTDIPEEAKLTAIDAENLTVTGDINFIREFMYTYTWGSESYAHEVQEQFGYWTLAEYKAFLTSLGAKLIVSEELLEPGYPEHLKEKLTLTDAAGSEVDYPPSNCILVAEKPCG